MHSDEPFQEAGECLRVTRPRRKNWGVVYQGERREVVDRIGRAALWRMDEELRQAIQEVGAFWQTEKVQSPPYYVFIEFWRGSDEARRHMADLLARHVGLPLVVDPSFPPGR